MARLNIERQQELEPERMSFAIQEIEKLGYNVTKYSDSRLEFIFKNHIVIFYPYSGWHTGKSIQDGRGLNNLLKQLNF